MASLARLIDCNMPGKRSGRRQWKRPQRRPRISPRRDHGQKPQRKGHEIPEDALGDTLEDAPWMPVRMPPKK